tara:strand:+ start:31366 stop:32211 length:846 start_codon:yes stop_codon:yes gene_type:complete
MPESAMDCYPGLGEDPSSSELAEAVEQFQLENDLIVDGKLGRGTWGLILKTFNHIANEDSFWTINDQRVGVQTDDRVKMVNFDQPKGLDLHRFGHFSSRKSRNPHLIVVHWGGLDPHHCYRVFSSPDREVSSHAGIGLDIDGSPTIYQYLDLNHKAWHGGWVNSYSVGIDICQQPSLKWKDHYEKKGYIVPVKQNDTGRGDKRVLSLSLGVALATREAVKTLCSVLDIPYQFPMHSDGSYNHNVLSKDYLLNGFTGVVGHHHLTAKKWDCACWWEDIFDER